MRLNRLLTYISCLLSFSSLGHADMSDVGYANNCTNVSDCNFCQNSPFHMDLEASYLYWWADQDQMAFAIENVTFAGGIPNRDPNGGIAKGKIITHEPQSSSGVRIAADLYCDCSPLVASVMWTGYSMHNKAHAGNPNSTFQTVAITSISAIPNMGDPFLYCTNADAKWTLSLNEFALDFKYIACCMPCLKVSPYVGVYAAWFKQKQHIDYFNAVFNQGRTNPPPTLFPILTLVTKNDFWGVGPRLGVGLDWQLCRNLSFIADANAAFVVGKYDMRNDISSSIDVPNVFIMPVQKERQVRPMINGLVGFEWNDQLNQCGCCYPVNFAIAYEFQYWWGMWHSGSSLLETVVTGEGAWGDLALHGLTITAGISF